VSSPGQDRPSTAYEDRLPAMTGVLAVVAHPDDESFGLGAVISELVGRGIPVTVLCFTHGEASTLHGVGGDLGVVRAHELATAGQALGVGRVDLAAYADGALSAAPLPDLIGQVQRLIDAVRPSHLLAFDPNGVTGHPDHRRASRAALAAAGAAGRPVLAWVVPQHVAERINAEFGTAFTGRPDHELTVVLDVSRRRQRRAIACHRSQSIDNPVLLRRLQLLGDREHLMLIPPHPQENPMSYGISVRLNAAFAPTVERVRAALKEQGFGVLTEIDLRATLRAKIGAEMEDYLILGACNPSLAHRAIGIDREIGLLLPCNVVVRADGTGHTLVQALDPQVMVQVTGRPELKDVADEGTTRLRAALDTLAA